MTITTPLARWFVIRWLGLAMVNLWIKFEVSVSIRCEGRKGDAKSRKWNVLG